MSGSAAAAAPAPRVCALLTTFNRRAHTLACLEALAASAAVAGVDLRAVLVDDASSDGTPQAVREAHPWVQVIDGPGDLYWCRGMHRAGVAAQAQWPDFLLWLNDDTLLRREALRDLLDCHRLLRRCTRAPLIVVGSAADPLSGAVCYGGERRDSWWRPLRFRRLPPADQPQPCDSMNGNIVLVDAAAAGRTGNLDPAYEHAMGDTDYALRAGRLGVGVWLAPGVHGSCSANARSGTYRDPRLGLAERWRRMLDRKGLPWRSYLHFARRHGGPAWPVYFVWPYARLVVDSLRPARRERT